MDSKFMPTNRKGAKRHKIVGLSWLLRLKPIQSHYLTHVIGVMEYHGIVKEIIEIEYYVYTKVMLFKCDRMM